MPNWCCTFYALVGDKPRVEAAYNALNRVAHTPRSPKYGSDSFLPDSRWLGYVVTDVLGTEYEKLDCRGTFGELELKEEGGRRSICFTTMTAWAPCTSLWVCFASRFNLSLNYQADEPGSEVYEKCNPDGIYPENYIYDSEEDGSVYFDTLAEFMKEYGLAMGLAPGTPYEEVARFVEQNTGNRLYRYEGCDDPECCA